MLSILALAATSLTSPCFVEGLSSRVECGELSVPLHHAIPDGDRLTMTFIRLPAQSATPATDPVVVIPGGPGQSGRSIAAMAASLLSETNIERDIIVIDPRGTGGSNKLACPFEDEDFVDDRERILADTIACRDSLDTDLTAYGSEAVADDLDLLRQALGAPALNLWGGSWGTRAALVYARRYPDQTRSMTLDSVAPTDWTIGAHMGADAQQALTRVFEACAEETGCSEAFPALPRRFDTLMNRLDARPFVDDFAHPLTGATREEHFSALRAGSALRGMLYSDTMIRVLPYTIIQAFEGRFAPLHAAAEAFNNGALDDIAFGMMLSVLCSEDIGRLDADAISDAEQTSFLGDQVYRFWLTACSVWPKHPVAEDFHAPVTSDIPSLLIAGQWDPVTPPYTARQAANHLSNSRVLEVAGAAHIASSRGCIAQLTATFIDSADPQGLDTGCVADIQPKAFFIDATGPELSE